jgi:hypothetical protein
LASALFLLKSLLTFCGNLRFKVRGASRQSSGTQISSDSSGSGYIAASF